MAKTQIGRSCFKFMKRHQIVDTCKDFYELYISETGDTVPYHLLEHYFCRCNSPRDCEPPARFLEWCQEKLKTADTDLAQHFTTSDKWLVKPVKDFIKSHCQHGVIDPYAGDCSLWTALKKIGVDDFIGLDIDVNMVNGVVAYNDSLVSIPATGRLVVTNPPYMSKCTATRYGSRFYQYFENTSLTDIYLLAIEKCLDSHENVVAIIPETFLLNGAFQDRLAIIAIIEKKIFQNTDCPVLVACWHGDDSKGSQAKVYKNQQYLFTLGELKGMDKRPHKKNTITFNIQQGNIGLRGIDSTHSDRIIFCKPEELNYDRKMKVSSRLVSIIDVPGVVGKEDAFLAACNEILEKYREDTCDLLMAPFKGNNKKGQRRRRIDYRTARAIMEEAIERISLTSERAM